MRKTTLVLSYSDKETLLMTAKELNEADQTYVSFDWLSLLSHVKSSNLMAIKKVTSFQKDRILKFIPDKTTKKTKEGCFFKSSFDGRRIEFSVSELLQLKEHFSYMVIPAAFSSYIPEQFDDVFFMLTPLEKLNDSPTYRNIAVNLDEKSVDNVLSVLKQFKESNKTSKIYVFGELTLSQCGELRECGIDFIETSSMLHDAANGRLQLEEGTLDITSAKWANDQSNRPVYDR